MGLCLPSGDFVELSVQSLQRSPALQDVAPWPPPAHLPQGVSDPVTVQTYRVKYEPFLEQIPSSGLTAETEEEQFLFPRVFSDPTAPQQEFWRKKAYRNKGNENLASWLGEQSKCCEKLGVTGN